MTEPLKITDRRGTTRTASGIYVGSPDQEMRRLRQAGYTKLCEQCGERYTKRPKEAYWQFDERRFCSNRCKMQVLITPCEPDCTCGKHSTTPPEDRFWVKVDKNGPISTLDGTRCWLWMGALKRGYGKFGLDGQSQEAQRIAYGWLKEPIPNGQDLDHRHTCPKNCVNPDHLRPVSHKQNMENHSGPQSNSKSGVRGVSWSKSHNRWVARVNHNGRLVYQKRFRSLREAEVAVIAARNRFHTHNDMDRVMP